MKLTYSETLTYLLEQLPMFQRVGAAAYRADLHNITCLCQMLDNPQNGLKFIHVAGTNGKGSVTHMLASVLQEQGYKTGVFVSPHYKDYRERIKINGRLISKSFVQRFVSTNYDKLKSVNASFFEITTAMAFTYFKEQKVDFAVIETGMGGRLDSTNIINPLLSVITNISFDHQQFLGNTLPLIAAEKAGIIKPGVPVVIGETQKETRPVFIAKAKAEGAPIYFAYRFYKKPLPVPALGGAYQLKNTRTALAAIEVMKMQGIKVSEKAIRNGLKNVVKNTALIGRWTVLGKKPLVVFDSAHNEGGLRELRKSMLSVPYRKLHFVYGTVNDKDISTALKLLPKNAKYYFCKANIPRGLDAGLLQQQAAEYKLRGQVYKSVKAALAAAKKAAAKSDLVLVAGSVFVVAEVI
ncbi:MAG TPA: folylpolyglutamate synthase/dihydrofolate synthase family protein [Chitinophagales bacterium]|nr:folylpolyglutamate synthase/dihydrofolate synthase family protein [Chitinophagales bacterium]